VKMSKEDKSKKNKSDSVAKEVISEDELGMLIGKTKTYLIGKKKFIVKPLVIGEFYSLFQHIVEVVSIVISANPELMTGDIGAKKIYEPEVIFGFIKSSEKALDKVYDIVAMVLKADKKFLLENLKISLFVSIIGDIIELNDISEIVANFTRIGSGIKKELKKIAKPPGA